MRPLLPTWFHPLVFGALLSGLMSLIVCCVATFRTIGAAPDFVSVWLSAWLSAWPVAFATVLFVAPLVRRLTNLIVRPAGG